MRRVLSLSVCVSLLFACGGTASVKPKAAAKAAAPVEAVKVASAAAAAVTLNADEAAFTVPNPKMPSISIYTVAKDEKSGAFTAIVKLKAGTKVPLHAHSHDYTGAALSAGLMRGMTEDSVTELPKGSAWVQKAGEGHINQCADQADCLMLVMFKGKLDMMPQDKPFAGESKSKTFKGDALPWIDIKKGGIKIVPLTGDMKKGAFDALFYFPAGLKTSLHTHSASFTGALISGTHHRGPSADKLKTITSGAVWHEPSQSGHIEQCGDKEACVFVGRFDGALDTANVDVSK